MTFGHLGAVIWPRWTIICVWVAVKDKCYADKPQIIAPLKNNIREAIVEIQLHTIDNEHKNWTDTVGYCIWIEIIFHY